MELTKVIQEAKAWQGRFRPTPVLLAVSRGHRALTEIAVDLLLLHTVLSTEGRHTSIEPVVAGCVQVLRGSIVFAGTAIDAGEEHVREAIDRRYGSWAEYCRDKKRQLERFQEQRRCLLNVVVQCICYWAEKARNFFAKRPLASPSFQTVLKRTRESVRQGLPERKDFMQLAEILQERTLNLKRLQLRCESCEHGFKENEPVHVFPCQHILHPECKRQASCPSCP